MTRFSYPDKSQYQRWRGILARCYNPNAISYPRYGGRGIRVCERWRTSYQNFLDDMGLPPTQKHSIGRIDNDRDYEPSNCRWETPTQQTRNFSRNRIIEFNGKRMCVAEWAEHIGISYVSLTTRLNSLQWTVERALTTPPLSRTDPARWEKRRENKASAIVAEKAKALL